MKYIEQYYSPYKDLCETGTQTIRTKDINASNIEQHFQSIINILSDGIETKEVQDMMLNIKFPDDHCRLSIFDYCHNLMYWQLNTSINKPIMSVHLIFPDDITKRYIKNYIDNTFIDKYRKVLQFIVTNQTIDNVIGSYRALRKFQPYLANTLNFEDTLKLMNEYPEFNDTMHFDITGIPLEDVKNAGMDVARTHIKYIKNSDHCLRDSFRTGEAISDKQYKEVLINVGSKPDGAGGVYPHPISKSFANGGMQTPEEICIESSVGRVAQILQKTNVGESGKFARLLELNNQDTYLHTDPTYVCDTHNFEEVVIENDTMLRMFNLRYYRTNPNGVDKLLNAKSDSHLIGQKLYFRSPMTCASAASGHGICYKCYGDLAYANQEVNIGQIAAEGLSSIYTQILLSAKHLLESLIVKLEWSKGFNDFFAVTFNTIGLIEGMSYRGYTMIIDEEIKSEEEIDEVEYNYYINKFTVRTPSGEMFDIHTSDADNIYFEPEFYQYISKKYDIDSEDAMEIPMEELVEFPALFIMEVRNNELSATMNKIKRLIDIKSVVQSYDRNSILREFIVTNIAGGIVLNSVHFEVLLMNQIRAADDELELPDWSRPNEPYQILTLSRSLSENRSITVRLQVNKVSKPLGNPKNDQLYEPSITDLYFMEKPQEYLDSDIISDEYKPLSDVEDNIIQPIAFNNPKIRVGRTVKKRKVPKSERN